MRASHQLHTLEADREYMGIRTVRRSERSTHWVVLIVVLCLPRVL